MAIKKDIEIKKKIDNLVLELLQFSKSYYIDNKSIVSDEVYDAKLNQLKKLEKKYPQFKRLDSPTRTVGYSIQSSNFVKVKHSIPMLSLDNVFNQKKLDDFITTIEKEIPDQEYCCEYKIDGVSISITYANGKVIEALTRGDGIIGERITNNALMISNLPLHLEIKDNFTIRGEVYFPLISFQKRNQELIKENKKPYKNPRNSVSGLLRQLTNDEIKKANLFVAFYDLLEPYKFNIKTQREMFNFFKNNKIPHLDSWITTDKKTMFKTIEKMLQKRDNLNFQVDGVVVKVNSFQIRDELGFTTKFPKWAIAFKAPSEKVKTKVINIFATLGRSGKITYNAKLEPVLLAGSTIQYVSLHNYDWLNKKDIRIGDIVYIHKAGDIIPEIISVDLNQRNNLIQKTLPFKECPYCHSKLEKIGDNVDQFCLNEQCDEKIIKQLTYFVSRDCLNINTLSDATIRVLYKKGWLKKLEDLFFLDKYEKEWKKIERFGEKSVDNVLNEIKNLKKGIAFYKILVAIGIVNIGLATAKKIENKFNDFFALKKATQNELIEVENIGEKTAIELYRYLHDKKNDKLINIINKYVQKNKKDKSNILNNQKFVITGVLNKPRKYYEEIIVNNGGIVATSISSKTNYLLIGENAGSKKEKALKLKTKIINENQFKELIKIKLQEQKDNKSLQKVLKELEVILRFSLDDKFALSVLKDFNWLKQQFNQISETEYEKYSPSSYPNLSYERKIGEKNEIKTLSRKTIIKQASVNVTANGFITYPREKK